MNANVDVERWGGGQEREEGGRWRGTSVRLLIRMFVFHYREGGNTQSGTAERVKL